MTNTSHTVQHALDTRSDLDAVRTGTVAALGTVAANDLPDADTLPATRDALLELIDDGRFFSVEFTKRDGSLRTMQARIGVTRHLAGGEKAYSDAAKGIVTVYGTDAAGYRSIRIDAIHSLTVRGRTYLA